MPSHLPPNAQRGDMTFFDGNEWRRMPAYTPVSAPGRKLPIWDQSTNTWVAQYLQPGDIDSTTSGGWKWVPISGGTYTVQDVDWRTYNLIISVSGAATIILPPVADKRLQLFIVHAQLGPYVVTVQLTNGNFILPDGTIQSTPIQLTAMYAEVQLICDGGAFFAINEATVTMRVDGDMLVRNAGHLDRIPKGTTGQYLKQGAAIPAWGAIAAADIPATWTNQAYNAGDYIANAGSWVVDAGDAQEFSYLLLGNKTMFVDFTIATSTTTAATSGLQLRIPAGRTANRSNHGFGWIYDGAAAYGTRVFVAPGYTSLQIQTFNLAAIPAVTNTLYVQGSCVLEVA